MKQFWCKVYLNNLEHNVKLLKRNIDKKIIAVVKGNAYGLGIEKITTFLNDKVDYFAVSSLQEAKKIKTNKEILILTPVITKKDIISAPKNTIFTVDRESVLHKFNKSKQYKVHIYVDTGMNRFGIKPENLNTLINNIKNNFPNIMIDGIYTHLHNTKNIKYTINQIEIFKKTIFPYIDDINIIHCLNSTGFINNEYYNKADFTNAIRVGNILYGFEGKELGYKKAFQYFAKPIDVYEVKKGEYMGYGNTFKTKKNTKVGILDLGYIDNFGYSKNLKHSLIYDITKRIYNHYKSNSIILCNEKKVKVLGQPTMNNVLINMDEFEKDTIFSVNISPVLADSSIPKIYTDKNSIRLNKYKFSIS